MARAHNGAVKVLAIGRRSQSYEPIRHGVEIGGDVGPIDKIGGSLNNVGYIALAIQRERLAIGGHKRLG